MAVAFKIYIFASLLVIATANLPSYIKKCKKGAEDLNECVLKNGQLALKHIVKGDEELGIPSFDPYKQSQTVRFGSKPNLQLEISNFEFSGLRHMQLTEASWDIENRKAHFKLKYENCTGEFDYKITGPFVGHVLKGEGHGSVTSNDAWFSFDVQYNIETVNDTEYAKIDTLDVDYEVGSCVFDLKNLADEEDCPEEELNDLLTANWKKFNSLTKQDSKKFKVQLCKTMLGGVFKNVPFDELFD